MVYSRVHSISHSFEHQQVLFLPHVDVTFSGPGVFCLDSPWGGTTARSRAWRLLVRLPPGAGNNLRSVR